MGWFEKNDFQWKMSISVELVFHENFTSCYLDRKGGKESNIQWNIKQAFYHALSQVRPMKRRAEHDPEKREERYTRPDATTFKGTSVLLKTRGSSSSFQKDNESVDWTLPNFHRLYFLHFQYQLGMLDHWMVCLSTWGPMINICCNC